eukprot:scpid15100/ scgid7998/ 
MYVHTAPYRVRRPFCCHRQPEEAQAGSSVDAPVFCQALRPQQCEQPDPCRSGLVLVECGTLSHCHCTQSKSQAQETPHPTSAIVSCQPQRSLQTNFCDLTKNSVILPRGTAEVSLSNYKINLMSVGLSLGLLTALVWLLL